MSIAYSQDTPTHRNRLGPRLSKNHESLRDVCLFNFIQDCNGSLRVRVAAPRFGLISAFEAPLPLQ